MWRNECIDFRILKDIPTYLVLLYSKFEIHLMNLFLFLEYYENEDQFIWSNHARPSQSQSDQKFIAAQSQLQDYSQQPDYSQRGYSQPQQGEDFPQSPQDEARHFSPNAIATISETLGAINTVGRYLVNYTRSANSDRSDNTIEVRVIRVDNVGSMEDYSSSRLPGFSCVQRDIPHWLLIMFSSQRNSNFHPRSHSQSWNTCTTIILSIRLKDVPTADQSAMHHKKKYFAFHR